MITYALIAFAIAALGGLALAFDAIGFFFADAWWLAWRQASVWTRHWPRLKKS